MKITVKGERGPRPTKLAPPGERAGTAIVNPGVFHPEGLTAYVTRRAWTLMMHHSVQGGAYEVGGFLVGGFHHYRGHHYIDIVHAVPALKAKSEKTHLTFDHEAQKDFHARFAARYPGRVVLGWYHSHPRYSVFLSEYDVFIQKGFFASEYHAAVVIDPYQDHPADRVGVFLWEDGRISTGYHLIVYESDDPEEA